ncbi:MAG: hypothetical protein ABR956_00205 [Terracidiphilus sp.]|jgi:hypothetical protein
MPQRFDLAAKHLYARFREYGVNSDWGRAVYAFHLLIWNQFIEKLPCKNSEADFLESFYQIIEATRHAPGPGLHSIIPLAADRTPLNGAHRIAAALLLGKSVACVTTEVDPGHIKWDHRFFERRAELTGFPHQTDIFDAMALEFCRMLPNIAIAIKFPAAKGRDEEVDRILREHATIFYRKAVTLENNGPVHFMRTVYEAEPWLGSYESDFDGARRKADLCFAHSGPVRFFLLAFDDQAQLTRAKERIRGIFGIEKHSIHITDTRHEALRVARLAFSNPSIGFINTRPLKEMPVFDQLLARYREALDGTEDSDDFCIDGSAVMAAYGIRDCADLDYISHGARELQTGPREPIGIHNDYAKHYGAKTLDDIIFCHRNHFYLSGMKFASLANVRDWKLARGEAKDQVDVALIDVWTAKHMPTKVGLKARATARRLWFTVIFMRRKMIRSLKESSLNSVRRGIKKKIRRQRP